MKTMKLLLALVAILVATTLGAMAQSGPTALPVDPTLLYTSVNTPTIAAVGIAIGFGALFIVIRWIKKAISR